MSDARTADPLRGTGLAEASRFHPFRSGSEDYLFVVEGSQIFAVDPAGAAVELEVEEAERVFAAQRLSSGLGAEDSSPPRVHALSLAVAQKCNMGCTYCYAQKGDFGAPPQQMSRHTALEAVALLFDGAGPGDKVSLSFLGGEPLLNRSVVRAATEEAVARAQAGGCDLALSVTSNGTLLQPDDIAFFEDHRFALTISLDGVGEAHDVQRPFKSGAGSYEHVLARVRPALERQRQMQVSARVTVTPQNLNLVETLETFLEMGFHSVGFSPLLHAPAGPELEMNGASLDRLLEQMIACGRRFEAAVVAGRRYPFLNLTTALQELHLGTHRPYPCGAGVGYFGVSADGALYACHRFVNDEEFVFGDLVQGVDAVRQAAWLRQRHVDGQEPCRSCWARYLCGGGCHHEVHKRGRPACDYIRGWLHYCLEAYTRLRQARPDYFSGG